MTKELSSQNEQFLDSIVAGGLFPSKEAALDAAIEALREKTQQIPFVPDEHMERLDQAFEAVATFKSMSDPQVEQLLAKTAEPSQSGEFEPFKTSQKYDTTAQHPAFLD